MARYREISTLPAGYIPQHKVTLASSSGSLGSIVRVKCCMMVDSVPRWRLSILANTVRPSVDRRLDDTAFGEETLSWQDPVHFWKAGPGEVMTVENLFHLFRFALSHHSNFDEKSVQLVRGSFVPK